MDRLAACLLAFGAFAIGQAPVPADPWKPVRELKSGTEMRIYKKGSTQAVPARMDELSEESLIVVVKNEQLAIPRDEIDKIEARPSNNRSITKETVITRDQAAIDKVPPRGPRQATNPAGDSMSSGLSIGGKPGFELIYRRPVTPPK